MSAVRKGEVRESFGNLARPGTRVTHQPRTMVELLDKRSRFGQIQQAVGVPLSSATLDSASSSHRRVRGVQTLSAHCRPAGRQWHTRRPCAWLQYCESTGSMMPHLARCGIIDPVFACRDRSGSGVLQIGIRCSRGQRPLRRAGQDARAPRSASAKRVDYTGPQPRPQVPRLYAEPTR